MHIPEHMLNGAICPVSAALSATAVGGAAVWASKSPKKPTSFFFAAVSAFIFSAQMLNFPVQNGTSGHLLGATLAAFFLGVPFAVLSMSFVLLVQTLVFADGGISVMGANIFNMAIVGVLPFALLELWHKKSKNQDIRSSSLAPFWIALASWLSVVLASAALSFELAWDGVIHLKQVFAAMVGVHSLIGIGEVALTLVVIYAFDKIPLHSEQKKRIDLLILAAFIMALLLSPFASSFPDGLEWIAEKYNFLHEQAPTFVAALPDYSVPTLGDSFWSTAIAGGIGTAIVFVLTFVFMRVALRREKHQN